MNRERPKHMQWKTPHKPIFEMLLIVKSLLSLFDILFPETIIRVVKQIPNVQQQITTTLRRKGSANQTAMDNPVVQSVLKEMSLRNFEPQRLNAYGVWYISDRH